MYSPLYISVEDPRQNISNEFPATIDDKEVFRLSIASQQSSTTTTTVTSNNSSQRLSVASTEEENQVAYCKVYNKQCLT